MHNLPLDDVIVHTLWTTLGSFSFSCTFLTFSVAHLVSCSFLGFWDLIGSFLAPLLYLLLELMIFFSCTSFC